MKQIRLPLHTIVAFPALFLCLAWLIQAPAYAIDPLLQKEIAHGEEAFLHNTFGGGGRVCNSCHLGGGTQAGQLPNGEAIPSLTNAAAIFPRVREQDHALITLADQVRTCVAGAIKGKAPEYGSEELNALVSYVTSLSQGKAIDMGGMAK
jgi:thiosulfate dehydrogenase